VTEDKASNNIPKRTSKYVSKRQRKEWKNALETRELL